MAFDAITSILNIGNSLIDRLIPDKSAQAEAKAQLLQMQVQGQLSAMIQQIDVDKTEAASANWFVAGWRPFLGWVCGFGLLYQFIVNPLVTFAAQLCHRQIVAPSLDLGTLMTLLFGMLGLGAMRTTEKLNDTAGNH
jgi:hypothetical protein